MYLDNNNKNLYVIDIETESLNPSIIWCVVIKSLETGQVWSWRVKPWYDSLDLRRDVKEFIDERPNGIWCGHNILSFDGPVLARLLNIDWPYLRTIDTLVLSYLYNPALEGGHSLESYGLRLQSPKIEYSDWNRCTEATETYCKQDVNLTEKVFLALRKKMNAIGFSEKSVEIEHWIRYVINEQEQTGFRFDVPRARKLLQELRDKQSQLELGIRELFPRVLKPVEVYRFRTRKDGSPYASYLRHLEAYPELRFNHDKFEYTVYDWEEFNLASPKQRVEKLLSLGWEPTKFTPGGQPQADEDGLLAFSKESGNIQVSAMAEWLVLDGRCKMLETWLECVGPDGRMHGTIFTCGATTRRMRHRRPNTANIPKAKDSVPYGKECRSLWTVEPLETRCLVGYDASGLEMRGFGHYLNDQEAARLYIEGDPHQLNATNLSLALGFEVSRHDAKTIFYAFLYGAGNRKLGEILKKGIKEGEIVRKTLIKTTPGLDRLTSEVQKEFERNGGLLRCIDGGYVRCPSEHAALNYKIQSAGGIVMKLASILTFKEIKKHEWDAFKVGDIHDESQLDCNRNCGYEVGCAGVWSIQKAGIELGFIVPLTGEFKIATNWSETH